MHGGRHKRFPALSQKKKIKIVEEDAIFLKKMLQYTLTVIFSTEPASGMLKIIIRQIYFKSSCKFLLFF